MLSEKISALGIAACGLVTDTKSLTYETFKSLTERGVPKGLQYLIRNAEVRKNLDSILPGTRNVLCIAIVLPAATQGWARFCAIGDYHEVVRNKLVELEKLLCEARIELGETRACVDSAPILERELAVRAGLGWISHNHMLVHPTFGAGIVLGELLVTRDLAQYAKDLSLNTIPFEARHLDPGSQCSCKYTHLCAQSCPTGALSQNAYDPARCLAYLTTQHTGDIDEPFATAMENVIWGCDRCQHACPVAKHQTGSALPFLERLTPELILTSSAKQLTRELAGTPMAAAHPRILQRNACIVLGNVHATHQVDLLQTVARENPCDWVQRAAQRSLNLLLHNLE